MNIPVKNTKLIAFTLPEIVISLLLISILFTIGLTIYMIVSKQGSLLSEKNSFYADYAVTKQALKNDFSKPGAVTVSDDKTAINIQYEDGKRGVSLQITYLLDSARTIRMAGDNTDTLQPGGIIVGTQTVSDSLPLVNVIKICSWYKDKPFFTYLQKNYSAEELLSAISLK